LVYGALGQYETAIDYLEQSLAIAQKIGHREAEGVALSHLGAVYSALRQYETAIDYLERSLAILEEIKPPMAEAVQELLDIIKQENDGD